MPVYQLFLLCCIAVVVAGCAPKTRYSWNEYDQKLYQHYKNPAEIDQFIADLKEVIEEGEEDGKVPPGIYAEYGFVLYEQGKYKEAVKYFSIENDKWPESRVLMAKMIQNAQRRAKQAVPPVASAGKEALTTTVSAEAKGDK